MKIVMPGGSGQVGTLLARAFVADGHEVVVLSRNPQTAPWRAIAWDGETLGAAKRRRGRSDLSPFPAEVADRNRTGGY